MSQSKDGSSCEYAIINSFFTEVENHIGWELVRIRCLAHPAAA